MKPTLKIKCVFLIFALLTSCVAATENKDMPTEKEVTDFIDYFEAPESGDFINSAYDAFIEEYPAGHCDVWPNGMISFYYYDPDSPEEYGAIYLDSNGENVKSGCGVDSLPLKSYTGEYVSKYPTPEEDPTPEDTPTDSNKEESTTNQEQSESIQELSESIQELSESIQEQQVTDEELPVKTREQVVTTPEQPVTTPEQPVTTPEQPVTTPEQPDKDGKISLNDIVTGTVATVLGTIIVKMIWFRR